MRYADKVIFEAASLATDQTSAGVPIDQAFGFACAVVITGTPTGNLLMQGSCDPVPSGGASTPVPTTWITISTTAIAAATSIMYNIDAAYYPWVRFVYTRTGGTGAITATFNAKGI